MASSWSMVSIHKYTQGGMHGASNTVSFALGQARSGLLSILSCTHWTARISASSGKCQGILGVPSLGILWVPGHKDFCGGCGWGNYMLFPPLLLLYMVSLYQPSRISNSPVSLHETRGNVSLLRVFVSAWESVRSLGSPLCSGMGKYKLSRRCGSCYPIAHSQVQRLNSRNMGSNRGSLWNVVNKYKML